MSFAMARRAKGHEVALIDIRLVFVDVVDMKPLFGSALSALAAVSILDSLTKSCPADGVW